MHEWSLEPLFSSYESKEFKNAIKAIEEDSKTALEFAENDLSNQNEALAKIEEFIILSSKIRTNFLKCFAYSSLRLATDALDEEASKYMNKLQGMSSKLTPFSTKFSKWLPLLKNLNDLIKKSDLLKEHEYFLKSIVDNSKHILSDKEESIISKMQQTSSNAWGQLHGLLTSTLEVDYEGEVITLSDVRNLAMSKDKEVRKKAYYAEIKALEKIELSIAYALNGVKGEVNTLSELRGFESPLAQAVYNSRMKQETLDALISAMREYLPHFHRYLNRKAELLGHKNGLPFYDLFAPVGESSKEFSVDEAMNFVFDNFKTFSPDLEQMARTAYKDNWIDFLPKKGKRGGAFCSNLHPIKQSRVLTNFSGSFSNVITLSHELGHAYHGEQIFKESILNASYTMPVAETASTFCETIVKNAALKEADKEEKIFILEQSLKGSTGVIVDILSRFIFEKEVFDKRKKTPLNPRMLKEMMLNAQKEAYGEALDHDFLHPYMWVVKGHYYRGGLSFYNFPYAFGLLFAKGIYAKFKEQGESFVDDIKLLLQKTGQMSVEDVASLVGIDLTNVDFWRSSLDVIKEEIDLFIELTK